MRTLPPTGGHAPGLRCSRLLRWPDESSACTNEPTHHVLWQEDGTNGLVCDRHAFEALLHYEYIDMHEYDPICSVAGALWCRDYEPSFCVVDDIPTQAAS